MKSPYAPNFTVTQSAHNALKEEIEGLNRLRKSQSAERDRLKVINAELLGALKNLQGQIQQVNDGDRGYTDFDTELVDEAIAKGESK